ncbi:receptor-type tyrosine-protein phosphatase kappa isoform X2 [Anabrus simplex]|uniref:receptor-type tyrosine-protein phosphatase kappa isoform X2 n=1 Tax=Anabrus simplex TaxID=316456 RepID=UPI0035A3C356
MKLRSMSGKKARPAEPTTDSETNSTELAFTEEMLSSDTTSSTNDDGNSLSSEVWLVSLLLLPVMVLVAYWLIIRHRRKKRESALTKFRMSNVNILSAGDSPVVSMCELQAQLGLLEAQCQPVLPPEEEHSRRVEIAELEEYVMAALASSELKRQHELFPKGCIYPCEYGQLPANKPKNRYGNLVAYDDTRVILEKIPSDPYSDYINANYIDGYNTPKMYIATQGPKTNTVGDFWRMVWQENVHIICMLTRVWEKDKVKSEQYWPDLGKQENYGQVNVMTTSNQVFADFTFRRLAVSCKGTRREIRHMHFTSWPDHGVPLYAQSVALYLKQLLRAPRGDGPILVHCSAGVGRTGTIILADINLRMAAAESAVDVLRYLQCIRKQRPNLVDNVEQYRLLHMVLVECLIEDHTAVPCDGDFRARVERLRGEGDLERQYQRLEHRCSQDQVLVEYLEYEPGMKSNKSRLNAVSINGFRIKDQFITCQLPTTQTVADFWQLVMVKDITVILVLNDVDLKQVEFAVWPTSESILTPNAGMEVNLVREMDEDNKWHTLEFTIGITKGPGLNSIEQDDTGVGVAERVAQRPRSAILPENSSQIVGRHRASIQG